jgi:hypothetical protein
MHAGARLPHKRIRTKKPVRAAADKPAKARKLAAAPAAPVPDPAVISLAAHRAQRNRRAARPMATEIYGLVEWIGPARDDWRRGEMEVHRSARMAMTVTRTTDGGVTLGEIAGYGISLPVSAHTVAALASGALPELVLALPGLRVTLAAAELLGGLPAMPQSAQVIAFPLRRSA